MRRFYLILSAALLCVVAVGYRNHLLGATPKPVAGTAVVSERHPRIRSAIRELDAAKKELQRAPHDFGGHRADAVVAVDHAIEQLKLALQYDRK